MATDPGNPTPPPPPADAAPPAPPPPGASREEWKAWRRQNRDYEHTHWRASRTPYGGWTWSGGGWGGWGIFWGGVLVLIGVYALLSNLGLLSWLRGDILFPSLLILLGIALIFRRGRWW